MRKKKETVNMRSDDVAMCTMKHKIKTSLRLHSDFHDGY